MKKLAKFFYVILLVTGCNKYRENQTINSINIDSSNISKIQIEERKTRSINPKSVFFDSINSDIFKKAKTVKDTLIYHFEIEDISSDGNEGIAFYHNLTLKKIKFKVQNSNRVSKQTYLFKTNDTVIFTDSLFLFNEDYTKLSFEESSLKEITRPNEYSSTPFYFIEFKDRLPFSLKRK